jgi:hypothetical protein
MMNSENYSSMGYTLYVTPKIKIVLKLKTIKMQVLIQNKVYMIILTLNNIYLGYY